MSSKDLAAAAKASGNAAFSAGNYEEAVVQFSEAIKHDPTDAIFYSNRSGAYASLKQNQQALEDAEKCIQLKPDFIKGYSRKGLALFNLQKLQQSKETYEQGLKIDPQNQQLKEGLQEVQKALSSPRSGGGGGGGEIPGMGAMFGPDMWNKLIADPVTKQHLNDPAFVMKMQDIQKNPNKFAQYASDPKVSQALGVLFGLGANAFAGMGKGTGGAAGTGTEPMFDVEDEEEEDQHENHAGHDHPHPHPHPSSSFSSKKVPEPKLPRELTPEEKRRAEADSWKEKGNAEFKAKKYDTAIECYKKAAEVDPSNLIYLNNISACQYERKDYESCIAAAKQAIELGKEQMASYKDIAKAWFRMGNAYTALKQYEAAIDAYERSNIEDYTDKTKEALKKVQAIKKKQDELSYINPALSDEEKNKGNEFYNQQKWKEAIDHYSEALKRNPNNYKVYSNRAACYAKLLDWQRALDDCDACLKQDPAFVKAYIRKGKIQHFLKQYHKALETFDAGLKLDPHSSELIEGRRTTYMAINTSDADPERAREAMKDPEIQQILRDPTINKVLAELQQDPNAAKAALNDKDIRGKIEKLIAAGVLSVK